MVSLRKFNQLHETKRSCLCLFYQSADIQSLIKLPAVLMGFPEATTTYHHTLIPQLLITTPLSSGAQNIAHCSINNSLDNQLEIC